MSRQLFEEASQGLFVDEGGRLDVLGSDGDLVGGVWRQAGDGVLVDARLDRPDFDAVDTDGVLEVRVGRQPRDDGRGGRHVGRLDARRAERGVLADDHGAGGVLGRLAVHRHRPHAYPMWLKT